MVHSPWGLAAGILAALMLARIVRRIVWRRRHQRDWRLVAWGGGPLGLAFAGAACGPDPSRAGGPFGRHRRPLGRSRWLRAVFQRLDTTPGQEREIRSALEDLVDRVRDAGASARRTRENLAHAVAGEAFDDAAFEATSARVDAATAQVKDAVRGALVRVHAALDLQQRARLAAVLEHGFWGSRRAPPKPLDAGPYRGAGASGGQSGQEGNGAP
jgi:uncharacterized membrane protein